MQELSPLMLIRNPAQTKKGTELQKTLAFIIDGYMTAVGEISRFIGELYKEHNPNASLIYNELQPLTKQQSEHYARLCDDLNDINMLDSPKV